MGEEAEPEVVRVNEPGVIESVRSSVKLPPKLPNQMMTKNENAMRQFNFKSKKKIVDELELRS